VNAAGGSGTRARTRELGYADGMLEMYELLRAGEKSWLDAEVAEAEAGNMRVAEVMGSIGAWLRVYGDYAFDAYQLHSDYLGRFARDVEHRAYLEREGYCGPPRRELPQREHSESN